MITIKTYYMVITTKRIPSLLLNSHCYIISTPSLQFPILHHLLPNTTYYCFIIASLQRHYCIIPTLYLSLRNHYCILITARYSCITAPLLHPSYISISITTSLLRHHYIIITTSLHHHYYPILHHYYIITTSLLLHYFIITA